MTIFSKMEARAGDGNNNKITIKTADPATNKPLEATHDPLEVASDRGITRYGRSVDGFDTLVGKLYFFFLIQTTGGHLECLFTHAKKGVDIFRT